MTIADDDTPPDSGTMPEGVPTGEQPVVDSDALSVDDPSPASPAAEPRSAADSYPDGGVDDGRAEAEEMPVKEGGADVDGYILGGLSEQHAELDEKVNDLDGALDSASPRLDAVTGRLADLESTVVQSVQELVALNDAVAAITDHIEVLYSQVQQPSPDGQDEGEAEPCRWAWRYASPDSAAQLWGELRDFVDWLNSRYSLDSERQIPPCWYRHSIAVEELTALMVSWNNAFFGPNTPRDDLLAWHSYWLWPCLDRLPDRAGWQRCKSNGHITRSSTITPTDDGFGEFTGGSAVSRRTVGR